MVFLGGAFYGAMLPLVSAALAHGFNPGNGVVVHNMFSVLILVPIVLIFFRQKITLKQFFGLLAISAAAYVMSASYYYALDYITPSATITFMFQYVWMSIIIQAIVERRWPRALTAFSGLVVILGTVLTTGVIKNGGDLNFPGVFFALASALGYSFFLLFSSRFAKGIPAVSRTAFVSVARLIVAVALTPGFAKQWPALPTIVGFGIPMALVGIIIPLILIQTAAPHLPNSVTSIMSASELPSGVLLSVIFVGERIGILEWSGIVLVLGGIVLSQAPELAILLRRWQKSRE